MSAEAVTAINVVRQADRAELRDSSAEPVVRTRSEKVNRVVNIVIAATALILLFPLMLLIAVAILLTSRGPIFYRQARVGIDRRQGRTNALNEQRLQDLGGEVFTIYKFRSMYVDAEEETGVTWAATMDPRVTPVGRFLRMFRLDELPQFCNVLRGEMNLVGPRPERPSIVCRLRESIPEYPFRQRARPGITGWAQVNQGYDSSVDDVRRKIMYDLEYLERQSLAEDLRIILKTVPVMLFKQGSR